MGSYVLGTKLTGKSASEISEIAKKDTEELDFLNSMLCDRVEMEMSRLAPHLRKSFVGWKGTKISFLRHLLATTPTNLKYTLNLKDYEYNPENEYDKTSEQVG